MTFTYGITISDLVFQHVNLYIVKLIGFRLISEEKRELMTSTFILQTVNVAVLILLAKTEISAKDTNNNLILNMPDLSEEWYILSAPILVKYMMFNVFSPQIDLAIGWAVQKLMQEYDQGF